LRWQTNHENTKDENAKTNWTILSLFRLLFFRDEELRPNRGRQEMPELLFVYGTLRRLSPHPMAAFLAERARFVGEGTVTGRLYDLGRYPGMTETTYPAERVWGDVYELAAGAQTLEELDRYENAESPLPSFFERGRAEVTLADGNKVQAMVYWFRGHVAESQRIASGDYGDVLARLF
jgi:gamma-glutamylcyclotransferase (GGCT)/AIG2-like uncharacterized protein YtfP